MLQGLGNHLVRHPRCIRAVVDQDHLGTGGARDEVACSGLLRSACPGHCRRQRCRAGYAVPFSGTGGHDVEPLSGAGNCLAASEVPLGGMAFRSAPIISRRSEEHASELQSLMRISYAVFCLKKKKITTKQHTI